MVTMICEMCGCRDVVKRNGLYVCSRCGTKYSPEDARKLLWKLDDEEDGERANGGQSQASGMPQTYAEWAAANRPKDVAATEVASDDKPTGCAPFTGLFIELIANVILATAALCQVTQKVPSILHGNIADLIFVLAGISAGATMVLSAVSLLGGDGKRIASLSAATCAGLCCVLALMNLGDGPLFPIIYLVFALVDAIVAWVLRKG